MQLLHVVGHDLEGWRVLALRGQLDVATAPDLRQRLQEEQGQGAARIVLDLAELEFLDSFGLGVLAGALKRARLGGGRLVVARPTERIRRVLALSGLEDALAPVSSPQEATGEEGAGPTAPPQ